MPRPLFRGFRPDWLRRARTERGWTQEALAVRVGTVVTAVGKWERGLVHPEPTAVRRLAEALGMHPREFTDVPVDAGTLADLRGWAGLTRAQAAEAAGLPLRRLFLLEHLADRPTDAEAHTLGRLYRVSATVLLAAWDRERAERYPDAPGPPTVQNYPVGGTA